MAGSLNKVTIMGHLGRDPEVRTFQNGGRVVNMRIATSESWKDRTTGERRERTEWHSVAIFSEPVGRIAEQYLRKGSKVYIEGQLETRKWQDQNGQDRYSTEIVLRPYKGELLLVGGRGDGDRGGQAQDGGYHRQGDSGRAGHPQQAPRHSHAPQRGDPYPGQSSQGQGGYGGGYGDQYQDDIPF